MIRDFLYKGLTGKMLSADKDEIREKFSACFMENAMCPSAGNGNAGMVATAGADGTFCFWDTKLRRRKAQFKKVGKAFCRGTPRRLKGQIRAARSPP